jgi:hypothetical protein
MDTAAPAQLQNHVGEIIATDFFRRSSSTRPKDVYLCSGETLSSKPTSGSPAGGVVTAFSRKICVALSSLPYRFLLASSSERSHGGLDEDK